MFIIKLFMMMLPMISSQQEGDKWVRVQSDHVINFLMPSKPQYIVKATAEFPSYIYQTKDLVSVYGVVCTDFSRNTDILKPENIQELYNQLLKGSLNIESAILKDERTVSFDGMLIKEIEYSVIDGRYEMTYFKRFIFRDNYVYQLTIGGRSRHRDMINGRRDFFFNSVGFKTIDNNEKNETAN